MAAGSIKGLPPLLLQCSEEVCDHETAAANIHRVIDLCMREGKLVSVCDIRAYISIKAMLKSYRFQLFSGQCSVH